MPHKQSLGLHWIRQLREKAEQSLEEKLNPLASNPVAQTLLHELRVYRIELEMQNETLRHNLLALEDARDRYLDIFEFAPAGYACLTAAGVITEINLAGTSLFGTERKLMLDRRFANFVMYEDRDRWYLYLLDTVKKTQPQHCEIRLLRGGQPFHVRLSGARVESADGQISVRLIFMEAAVPSGVETSPDSVAPPSPFVERRKPLNGTATSAAE